MKKTKYHGIYICYDEDGFWLQASTGDMLETDNYPTQREIDRFAQEMREAYLY